MCDAATFKTFVASAETIFEACDLACGWLKNVNTGRAVA